MKKVTTKKTTITEASLTTERKLKASRISIVSNVKWFRTADGKAMYSYLPQTLPNRKKKDDIATVLKEKNIDVTVLTKEISLKNTGEKINSYVIITDSASFSEAFPTVPSKVSTLTFTKKRAEA